MEKRKKEEIFNVLEGKNIILEKKTWGKLKIDCLTGYTLSGLPSTRYLMSQWNSSMDTIEHSSTARIFVSSNLERKQLEGIRGCINYKDPYYLLFWEENQIGKSGEGEERVWGSNNPSSPSFPFPFYIEVRKELKKCKLKNIL